MTRSTTVKDTATGKAKESASDEEKVKAEIGITIKSVDRHINTDEIPHVLAEATFSNVKVSVIAEKARARVVARKDTIDVKVSFRNQTTGTTPMEATQPCQSFRKKRNRTYDIMQLITDQRTSRRHHRQELSYQQVLVSSYLLRILRKGHRQGEERPTTTSSAAKRTPNRHRDFHGIHLG